MDQHDSHLPNDLQDIAERLRSERPEATGMELDRAKLLARARVRRSGAGTRFFPRRARVLTTFVVAALCVGGTGTLIAATGDEQSAESSAAKAQYCPKGKEGDDCRKGVQECKKTVDQEKKDYNDQQKTSKKSFDDQQKAEKDAFNSQPHTKEEKKAFEDQQKAQKKSFDDQQKSDQKSFDETNKQRKSNCETQGHP